MQPLSLGETKDCPIRFLWTYEQHLLGLLQKLPMQSLLLR
jgi:hypothetical protein